MAAINDLIAQIQDIELRNKIEQEVNRMNKQKKFGLVFEEHLPEYTPLYEMPVKCGSNVTLKSGNINEIYRVVRQLLFIICMRNNRTKPHVPFTNFSI